MHGRMCCFDLVRDSVVTRYSRIVHYFLSVDCCFGEAKRNDTFTYLMRYYYLFTLLSIELCCDDCLLSNADDVRVISRSVFFSRQMGYVRYFMLVIVTVIVT